METLTDLLPPLPLLPSTFLTGKTKFILPPPGKFQREDTCCKCHWRHVQHITNEFCNRWSEEYLQILRLTQKWTHRRRNFTEDDIVLLKDNNSCRNKWPKTEVLTTHCDNEGQVRLVTIQTGTGSALDRPVNKLVLLVESPEDRLGIPDEEPEELWCARIIYSGGSMGGAGEVTPLIFRPNWGLKGRKSFFGDHPPPPNPKVWIRHWHMIPRMLSNSSILNKLEWDLFWSLQWWTF